MKVLIAGSSGMIGSLVLENCLHDPDINEVISLVRKSSGRTHDKLTEVIHTDFKKYDDAKEHFKDLNCAFFCIGVYTGQVNDELFKEITVDYAVRLAEAVYDSSPGARYCLLSGSGADRTEKSRTAFARYKGMSENRIDALGIEFYSFRPAYIYPVHPRNEPNLMYRISRTLYPLIKLFGKNASITSVALAKAMFEVGKNGHSKSILENRDILDYLE